MFQGVSSLFQRLHILKNICFAQRGTQDVSKPFCSSLVFCLALSSAHALTNEKNISGVLFSYQESESGNAVRPIIGAQVVLYYDDGDSDETNDVMVSDADMATGQQSQAVGSDGAYQFTVNPGAYRLKVVTGDPLLVPFYAI